jgi:hypothetical protein
MEFVLNKQHLFAHMELGMEIHVFLLLKEDVLMVTVSMELSVLEHQALNVQEVQLCKEIHASDFKLQHVLEVISMVQFALELFKVNVHHHTHGMEEHAHLLYQCNVLLDILMMVHDVFNKVKLGVLQELGMDLFV